MKTIAWLPENLNANRSFFKFKQATELAGFKNIGEKELYSNLRETDYLVLNFYEDIQKKFGFYFIAFIGRYIRLMNFKLNGIKVLWMLNNKIPHDDNAKWSVRMMKVLVKHSFKIVCLCHESKEVLKDLCKNEKVWNEKLIFIPHPNYLGAYKIPENTSEPEKFTALFFGSIRPYKNVDTLIETFKILPQDKVKLIVAGKVKNPEYQKKLENLAKGYSSINLIFKYIDDDEIMELIQRCSVVVLPYDNKTTLNSGSILLACSAGKTFISPMIGTLKDFPDKSLFYSYTYETEEEHKEKLKEKILEAYDDYEKSSYMYNAKGSELYNYVKIQNSSNKIAGIIKDRL